MEKYFADRLREVMADRGIGVAELAGKVAATFHKSFHSTQVYRYLNGGVLPSTPVLVALATVLDVSTDELLAAPGSPIRSRASVAV